MLFGGFCIFKFFIGLFSVLRLRLFVVEVEELKLKVDEVFLNFVFVELNIF